MKRDSLNCRLSPLKLSPSSRIAVTEVFPVAAAVAAKERRYAEPTAVTQIHFILALRTFHRYPLWTNRIEQSNFPDKQRGLMNLTGD